MIRPVNLNDAAQIADIYNHYILHSAITFETAPLTEEEMRSRIALISRENPYLVEEEDGQINGYCYYHRWKEREAYRHSVETTVYVHPDRQRQGSGRRLMLALIEAARRTDVHCMIACITCPNAASEALHKLLGFRQVSLYKEVGRKFGRWLDVYDFELLL